MFKGLTKYNALKEKIINNQQASPVSAQPKGIGGSMLALKLSDRINGNVNPDENDKIGVILAMKKKEDKIRALKNMLRIYSVSNE